MKNKTEAFVGMVTTSLTIFAIDSDNFKFAIIAGVMSIILLVRVAEQNKNLKP
jgi:hypothetical protein